MSDKNHIDSCEMYFPIGNGFCKTCGESKESHKEHECKYCGTVHKKEEKCPSIAAQFDEW